MAAEGTSNGRSYVQLCCHLSSRIIEIQKNQNTKAFLLHTSEKHNAERGKRDHGGWLDNSDCSPQWVVLGTFLLLRPSSPIVICETITTNYPEKLYPSLSCTSNRHLDLPNDWKDCSDDLIWWVVVKPGLPPAIFPPPSLFLRFSPHPSFVPCFCWSLSCSRVFSSFSLFNPDF